MALLLERGAEVGGRMAGTGRSPLHVAAARTSPEAAEVLLKAGADINAR
jgi:ankyrin repeat protein